MAHTSISPAVQILAAISSLLAALIAWPAPNRERERERERHSTTQGQGSVPHSAKYLMLYICFYLYIYIYITHSSGVHDFLSKGSYYWLDLYVCYMLYIYVYLFLKCVLNVMCYIFVSCSMFQGQFYGETHLCDRLLFAAQHHTERSPLSASRASGHSSVHKAHIHFVVQPLGQCTAHLRHTFCFCFGLFCFCFCFCFCFALHKADLIRWLTRCAINPCDAGTSKRSLRRILMIMLQMANDFIDDLLDIRGSRQTGEDEIGLDVKNFLQRGEHMWLMAIMQTFLGQPVGCVRLRIHEVQKMAALVVKPQRQLAAHRPHTDEAYFLSASIKTKKQKTKIRF